MRNEILDEASMKIFGKVFDFEDWQIAELIIHNFSVPSLGEELAKQVIFKVVNHTIYPNQEITTSVVGHAESLATELFDGLSDEPHMAQLEWLENKS